MKKVFLSLWLVWHLVFWYASVYSPYPNQIHWAYSFSVFAFALIAFTGKSPLALTIYGASEGIPGLKELLLLIGVYFSAFLIVSIWELFPGTTLAWGKFELVNLCIAITFYILGRVCSEDIIKAHYYLAIALVGLTLIQMGLDREAIRYGYGWQLMMCLPACVLLRKYSFTVIGIAVMFASHHKTALVGAIIGVLIVWFFARIPKEKLTYLSAVKTILASTAAIAIFVALFPQIVATAGRFLTNEETFEFMGTVVESEGIDISRTYVAERSIELLKEFFPKGMGYMNFLEWTGLEIADVRTTRLGVEIGGISLHNSYMTWVLEGGILVTLAVLLLFARTWKRVRWLVSNDRNFGVLTVAWCVAALLLGAFHQLHQTMQFWGTLGLIFGYYDAKAFHIAQETTPNRHTSQAPIDSGRGLSTPRH